MNDMVDTLNVKSILLADARGIILGANNAAYRLMRCPAGALIGRSLVSTYSPVNDPEVLRAVMELQPAHTPRNIRVRKVCGSGDTVPCEVILHFLTDPHGVLQWVIEVADEARNDEQMNEELVYMSQLLENAAHCIISTDPHGIIKSINKAGERMFGFAAEELIGKHVSVIQSPSVSPALLKRIGEHASRGEDWETETLGIRKGGCTFPIWLATSYLFDDQGGIKSAIGISRDITRQKETEERLRYMAQLIESAAHCIISTDSQGIVKSINKAGERMFGYTAEELIGTHVSVIQSPNISGELLEQLNTKARRGEQWEAESLGIRKDGTQFPVWLATSYLFDEEGRIKSAIGISRDITKEKEVEDRMLHMAELAESAAHCIISTNKQGVITSINRAGEVVYGYTAEELIGKHVSILHPDRLVTHSLQRLKTLAMRGNSWEAEFLAKRKDGDIFPVWLATSYLHNERGEITGAVGISRDITELKGYQEKLRYMAQLLENAAHCIISTDYRGIIKSINKAGERMFGFAAEELIGKHVSVIQSPIVSPALLKRIEGKAARGDDWETETLGIRKDGSIFPIWLATSYLLDEEGIIKSAIGISRDISRQKETEERLRYMARLIENAAHGIISTDVNNIIRSVNKAAEALYGYRADELVGQSVSLLFSGRNAPEYLQRIQEKTDHGHNWEAELWRTKKNGEDILIWISTSYIFDENGRIKTKISIERDITKVKQMEEELLHSAKLASLGEMAAGIAHEIKNPLTGITLGLEKLEGCIPPESAGMQTVDKVSQEIERINGIVSRLLDLSRKRKPEMEILQVNGIIRDVLLNIAPLAKQNRTTVKTELSAALPALNADGGQLYQVFLNLALNAIQAMPSGGALTIATRESAYEGKRMAAISFSDTGVGISRENLRRIFEPFFSTRKGGTGLGMSISHRIVRDHGGRIDVTSVPGHGTTITVLLPVSDADSTTSPSETG